MKSGKALSDTPGPVSESPKAAQGNGRFPLDADNFDGLTYCIHPPWIGLPKFEMIWLQVGRRSFASLLQVMLQIGIAWIWADQKERKVIV